MGYKKICGIYKITSPTNKIYVGQSTNIKNRFHFYKHLHCKTQILLYRSLTKHGVNNHKFEVLHECDSEQLNDLEIYYMDFYQCLNRKFGLNLKEGGLHAKMSDETKNKIRLKATGRKFSNETKSKIGKRMLGNKYRLGKSVSGWKHTEETKEVMRQKATGRIHSKESIEKRVIKNTGKKRPLDAIIKTANAKRGRKMTEEQKNHLKLAWQKRKLKNLVETLKERYRNE